MATMRMSIDDSQFRGRNKTVNFHNSRGSIKQGWVNKITTTKLLKTILFLSIITLLWFAFPKVKSILSSFNSSVSSAIPIIPVADPELKKDKYGKTNVLLIGIDTRSSGPLELSTDTIILASYDKQTNRLAMLSFPRDLSLTYPTSGYVGRINGLYAGGELKKKGTGLETLRAEVEKISGQEIHYAGMVDLKGFTDAINILGGIDIYVDNDLTGSYPNNAGTFSTVSFKKGWNKMNGTQALQYSRLRHTVQVSEASDFARARRQQKVIQAALDKATKSDTLLDAKKIYSLITTTLKNTKTTKYSIEDLQAGVSILKKQGKPETFSYVLDDKAGGSLGRLVDVISLDPWLLGPRLGQDAWSEIQNFIKMYFEEPSLPTMTKKVLVQNTVDAGFADKYKAMTGKYYFVKFQKGTKVGTEFANKAYAVGGKQYEVQAKYFAKIYGLTYEPELPEYLKNGGWKDVGVVIVL